MRRVIAELAASTRKEQYVTVVQERVPLLSSSNGQQVVPLKLLAVRAVMTQRLDYWANCEVAPALCRVLDISQTEYKICDNCCSAQPLDMRGTSLFVFIVLMSLVHAIPVICTLSSCACSGLTGKLNLFIPPPFFFSLLSSPLPLSLPCCPSLPPSLLLGFRIRWLVESYLGLKHVPFEHFACSSGCARTLNDSFRKVQSKLKQEHDQDYQNMLDQYTDTEGKGRARHYSFLRKRRKELEVQEMWCADFSQLSTGTSRQRQSWAGTSVRTGHSRYSGQFHSRTSCTLM